MNAKIRGEIANDVYCAVKDRAVTNKNLNNCDFTPLTNEQQNTINDIDSRLTVFINNKYAVMKMFEEYFEETALTEDEMWILCDYMKTYYTLKTTAELFRHGYSWQTSKALIDNLKSEEREAHINKVLLPELFSRIAELLSPAK